jgi:S-methylmethionine-dependent homocysteine/selenocysteine methylase
MSVTKEQVKERLRLQGHTVAMESFVCGCPITELEAITDLVNSFYQDGRQDAVKQYYASEEIALTRNDEIEYYKQRIEELSKANIEIARSKLTVSEAEELEAAIKVIQKALGGSFNPYVGLSVFNDDPCCLTYGDRQFLVEYGEAWQAIQSVVYLSGLEK